MVSTGMECDSVRLLLEELDDFERKLFVIPDSNGLISASSNDIWLFNSDVETCDGERVK